MRQIMTFTRTTGAKSVLGDAIGLAAICVSVVFVLSLPGLG